MKKLIVLFAICMALIAMPLVASPPALAAATPLVVAAPSAAPVVLEVELTSSAGVDRVAQAVDGLSAGVIAIAIALAVLVASWLYSLFASSRMPGSSPPVADTPRKRRSTAGPGKVKKKVSQKPVIAAGQ